MTSGGPRLAVTVQARGWVHPCPVGGELGSMEAECVDVPVALTHVDRPPRARARQPVRPTVLLASACFVAAIGSAAVAQNPAAIEHHLRYAVRVDGQSDVA